MSASEKSMLDRIVEYIRTENLAPGDPIPSVRELANLWGLGRNLVHQGMIQAETLGLITVRPRAGAFVKVPDYSILADALVASLNPAVMFDEHATLSHLNQARVVIEIESAGQAAQKRTQIDLVDLKKALSDFRMMADNPDSTRAEYVEVDERLHLAIARTGGNPVLYNILKALLALLRVQRTSMISVTNLQTVEAHTWIYEAIQAGDPDEAREAMKVNLVTTAATLAEAVSEM